MSARLAYLDTLYRTSGPALVDKLNEGFPVSVFVALAEALALPQGRLAAFLGLSDRTLRKRGHRLSADEAERSFRTFRVFRRAQEVLGDEEQARLWLNTPQLALGERRPIELLVRDVGAEQVLNLLAAIEDGGYV